MSKHQLTAVRVGVHDVEQAANFLAAVSGGLAESDGRQSRVQLGGASIVVGPSVDDRACGITAIEISGAVDVPLRSKLNNVDIVVNAADLVQLVDAPTGVDVVLDHVAILVKDLDVSAAAWERATGCPAELIGLHPVSNGTLRAARLPVGDRMIELISPVAGTTSAAGIRLARAGEGPMALALPATDLAAKRAELQKQGIRLLWQEPHWLVHPANPACVLIQLTPRVSTDYLNGVNPSKWTGPGSGEGCHRVLNRLGVNELRPWRSNGSSLKPEPSRSQRVTTVGIRGLGSLILNTGFGCRIRPDSGRSGWSAKGPFYDTRSTAVGFVRTAVVRYWLGAFPSRAVKLSTSASIEADVPRGLAAIVGAAIGWFNSSWVGVRYGFAGRAVAMAVLMVGGLIAMIVVNLRMSQAQVRGGVTGPEASDS